MLTVLIDGLRRHTFNAAFLTVVGSAGLTSARAQVQFPVDAPAPKVGEIVKYRAIDLWNKTELFTTQSELVAIEANHFVTRFKRSDRDAPGTERANMSWNFCRAMQNSDKQVCDGPLKFPMQIGNKHAYKEQPWSNGLGHWTATCEVVSEDKLTVPAGTFDTVRITCSGFYQRVFEGNWNGRFNNVTWYAPAISRVVKFEHYDFNGAAAFNKQQTELVEFTPGK
jgi:hypothetical protein